jgi:putative transposase
VLTPSIEVEFKKILKDIAKTYEYEVLEKEVMPDHIHLFMGAKPTVAPIDMIRTIKSITAIQLFKKFPKLKDFYRKCGRLWSRGSFVSTIGKVSEATIRKYIQDQKGVK